MFLGIFTGKLIIYLAKTLFSFSLWKTIIILLIFNKSDEFTSSVSFKTILSNLKLWILNICCIKYVITNQSFVNIIIWNQISVKSQFFIYLNETNNIKTTFEMANNIAKNIISFNNGILFFCHLPLIVHWFLNYYK